MAEERSYQVMIGPPGGKDHNTIVIGGVDIVVPLERDLDGDPYQDDEVWLRSLDGRFEQRRLASDPDVVEDTDTGLLLYRFKSVPHGLYSVWVNVGGQPSEVMRGLVVRREGVFVGDQALTTDPPKDKLKAEPEAASGPEEDESEDPLLENPDRFLD